MARRLAWLGACAILAVVLHHAVVHWDLSSIYAAADAGAWTDGWAAHIQRALRELTLFSVPAFLAISGFFVAYVSRSDQHGLSWSVILKRLITLLVPYTIWQLTYYAGSHFVQGNAVTLNAILIGLLTGNNISGYYYVPLLAQLYLLAPWILRLAKWNGRALLVGSGLVQFALLVALYWPLTGLQWPMLEGVRQVALHWEFALLWVHFFCLGVVISLNQAAFARLWARVGRWIMVATIMMAVVAYLESEWLFSVQGKDWTDSVLRLPSSLYAIGFIISFLASKKLVLPFSSSLNQLSSQTYGVYLLHVKIMDYLSRVFWVIQPKILAGTSAVAEICLHGWMGFSLFMLFAVGLFLPLLLMKVISRSPAKRWYGHLFG